LIIHEQKLGLDRDRISINSCFRFGECWGLARSAAKDPVLEPQRK